MRYFPIFVDLKDRRVIVVGGGEEATRKVRLLLKTGAIIEVIAAELHEELASNPRVHWLARSFAPALLEGAALVYSAEKEQNIAVSEAAQAFGIPVNAVDEADISTFIVPSIVDRDPVVVAIGTEGTAPVLAQGIRAGIDALLPHGLGKLAIRALGLRGKVANLVPHGSRRRAFWQEFFYGEPRAAFDSGDDVAFDLALHDAIHANAKPAVGHVSLVEADAGDPELLTLKAHRKLLEADVIVHDHPVSPAILEMARRDAVRIAVAQPQEILSILLVEARKGQKVVRLNANSRTDFESKALAAAGISVDVVPGISATPAAPPAKPFSGNGTTRNVSEIISFPVREDIRDAILRAAT